MSLRIDIESYDYKEAVKTVKKMLDQIELVDEAIIGIPSADDIVDAVWDAIK